MRHLAFVLALLLCTIAAYAIEAPAPRPHIVIFLADDLGSHDVSWRGGEIPTQNLDKLARGGKSLEQFYVQPVCSPTRAALLTGRYPLRHGLQVGVVRPWAEYGLPLDERTLPQALSEVGYATAIVGKWHLGHSTREYLPTSRGFQHQYGHYNGALDYFTHIRDGGFDWHRDDRVNRDEGYSTHLVAKEAIRLVNEHDPSKPLLLYVPFNAVHAPHQVPDSYLKPFGKLTGNRKLYAGMLAAMDEAIGQITDSIDQRGMRDKTLFIFSSDNGGPSPGKVTSNGKLRAGKGTVYEGGVRVCAFANWQGVIKPGEVQAPLHIVDWYPTLLKLAGAKAEQAKPLDGRDLWGTLTGGKPVTRDPICLNVTPNGGAIRAGDMKLVIGGDLDVGEGDEAPTKAGKKGKQADGDKNEKVELYDLSKDPSEEKNLAADQPDKVKELRTLLAKYAAEAVPPKSAPKPAGFKTPKVWGE
jgi:arylsulfatase A-like enzyme